MSIAQTGENNGHKAKLSVEDVKQIKRLLQKGVKQVDLARRYDVSKTLIHNIAHGIRWASVSLEDTK